MKYNFDEVIDRNGTHAFKLDAMKSRIGKENLIPLWVADMDFKSPPEIVEAFSKRVEHAVFGYTIAPESYYQSIINWVKKLYNWGIQKEEVSYIPGIVKGIAFAIDHFTNVGDKIIIQPPVYHPFNLVPKAHERQVVDNPLIFDGNSYRMDLEGLKKILKDNDCKMLILSNPHNPAGIVWDKNVLSELAEICYDNKVLVISDEIHSEIIHKGFVHIPFATVSEKAANNCITFMAPSKTFNLAGIIASYSIIKNKEIRNSYYNYLKRSELNQGSIFSYLGTEIAYDQCNDWRLQMIDYIWKNVEYVDSFMKENIPQIKVIKPQASFLIWLDCNALELSREELVSLFVDKAGLALNEGETFGKEGKGFMRLNVGCPVSVLERAMKQLKEAI